MAVSKLSDLPREFQNPTVEEAWNRLKKRRVSLFFKRVLDILISFLLIILFSPLILVLMICVAADSKGPVFFLQERVGRYGKPFRIIKFRTMVQNAEALGAQVTGGEDPRITRMGRRLRSLRLDEIPQLFNIFAGQMSFVGTRPEVPRYVAAYDDRMRTTLLLPPGLTSMTSIRFRNESELLENAENPDEVYIREILPEKMKYNVEYLEKAGPFYDLSVMWRTVTHVFFKCGED